MYSLAVQADGKILVGGDFTTLGGQTRNYIGRLNADGTLDTGFNPGPRRWVVCIRWRCRRTGRFWWAAHFTTLGGQPRNNIGRLNADGTLDTGFNPGAEDRSSVLFAGGAGGREDSGGRRVHHAGRAAAHEHWPAEQHRTRDPEPQLRRLDDHLAAGRHQPGSLAHHL